MSAYVKDAGIWKPTNGKPWVRDAGVWKQPVQGYVRDAGVWKPFLAPPKVLTWRAAPASAADTATYTFAAQPIGTAAADRYVIVGTTGQGTSARTITSLTIGGVAATEIITNSASTRTSGIHIALVPSGTTADIVVNWSGGQGSCAISVWSATGLTDTAAHDSDFSVTHPHSVTISTLDGGFAVAMEGDAPENTSTWTNATERADANADGSNRHYSAADAVTTGADLTITCTNTDTSSTARNMLVAAW